ncbi:YdcF family protein [Bacillus timonensis]|nr:YdcF family protein [Bacillus timonensis]
MFLKENKKWKVIFVLVMMLSLLFIFGRSFGVLFLLANVIAIYFLVFIRQQSKKSTNTILNISRVVMTIGYVSFVLSFLIFEGWILFEGQSSKNVNDEEIDAVIILGAGLRGDQISKTLEGRLEAGLEYLMKNKSVPVIVSGGQGPGELLTEAEAMGNYLLDNGVAKERIYYESLSTSTYENIKFSKEILEQLQADHSTILIVTSDYHLLRAKMIGESFGLTCYGLAGDSPLFVKINYYIREYFGIVKTYIDLKILTKSS